MPGGTWLERAQLAFFRAFFTLLLGFIAVAEWATLAWVLGQAGFGLPIGVHLAAPVAVFLLNRTVLARRRPLGRMAARALRFYAGVAFTTIFCGLFLGLASLAWAMAHAAATPVGVVLGSVLPHGLAPVATRAFVTAVNLGLGSIAGLFLVGYTAGQRRLVTTRLTVPVAGLPPALDGFRIVQISDLHIGQYLDRVELAAHVARVNALTPDLVCITGDLVDRADTCALAFPVLAGLRARHGVLATLGNHDVGAGADAVTSALRRLTSFTVLRDARIDLAVGDARLTVVGLDDLGLDWARGAPEHPALPGLVAAHPLGDALVVLSHRPDCFPHAARCGATLVLSGHTHGGQLGLPTWPGGRVRNLAEFITRYDRGRFTLGTATLYVNRGLGFTGQRIRLFTPREITYLELQCA
ncbi:MAG: metallophosphoesterase [Candidatus Binatia bacterium]